MRAKLSERIFRALVLGLSAALVAFAADPGRYWSWRGAAETERAASPAAGAFFETGALSSGYEIFAAPGPLGERAVSAIRGARTRVWMQVYLLTDKGVLSALKERAAAGVDVRVLMEGNVYGQPTINRKAYAALAASGAKVIFSDPSKFNFTHAKWFLADGAWYVGTANFSHAAFADNREFLVSGTGGETLSALEKVFSADFSREPAALEIPPVLVLSPVNSRAKILSVLRSAEKSLDVYAETLSDPDILSELGAAAARGVRVRALLGHPSKISANSGVLAELAAMGVEAYAPKKPYVHAKAAVADGTFAYVGSANYSANSLGRNREAGMLLSGTGAAWLSGIFDDDFRKAQGAAGADPLGERRNGAIIAR